MKENGKVRTIWLRILGYFLMGMLLLTILSRAADSIMLPAVKTARPLPGALTHTVILNGTVEAKELYPVIATDGMIVTKVHVRAGQQIKAGDTLLSYDMETLQSELKAKKTALERVTLEGKRQAAGSATDQDNEVERRILRLDTEAAQAEVDRVNALIANGGIVVAPADGTVIEVLIQPGEVASGAVFRIAPASSGMIARASVDTTQWPYLQPGMEASVQRQGETRGQRVLATLSELIPSESGYEAVFELPDSAWSVGQVLTMTLTQTTDTYDMRVPLGAIAESNGNKGVYRVRTGDSVLGETEYAEFVPVKVIETDAQYAAIEATLSDKDQIIISTSKPVNDGDRVRSRK